MPARRTGRRTQSQIGKTRPMGTTARISDCRPELDRLAWQAQAVQELRQTKLGVGGLTLNLGPGLIIAFQVQSRQHHRPLGQVGNDRQQPGGRRD